MNNVKWIRPYYDADPCKVADELLLLGDSYTAKDVVDLARDENTELHKCFEWDDSIAAEKYRQDQARNIIRLLIYKEDNSKKSSNFQSNVRISYFSEETKTYRPTSVIVSNPDEYKSLLNRAYEELKSFKRKYNMLTELKDILDRIPE